MPEMCTYWIVDDASRKILDRCSDHEEAKRLRSVLQTTRGRSLRIQKVPLPDPPLFTVNVPRTDSESRRKLTIKNQAKLDLSSERVSRISQQHGFDSVTPDRALSRLEERLRIGPWNRERYRKLRRRYRARPSDDGTAPTLVCEVVEIAVIRIVAQKYPYNQFAVTPAGDVFVGYQMGYHSEAARLYVTTLSPILDEAADLLLARSLGEGGRFYVHRDVIERATDKSLLAHIELEA